MVAAPRIEGAINESIHEAGGVPGPHRLNACIRVIPTLKGIAKLDLQLEGPILVSNGTVLQLIPRYEA